MTQEHVRHIKHGSSIVLISAMLKADTEELIDFHIRKRMIRIKSRLPLLPMLESRLVEAMKYYFRETMKTAARYILHALCFAALAMPALAAERGNERGERWQGDIRHFHERNVVLWCGGHWFDGAHEDHHG